MRYVYALVAHRLSTVTLADRIVALDAGQVRAAGTRGQLIDLDELCRELAATQLLAVRDEDHAEAGLMEGHPHRIVPVA